VALAAGPLAPGATAPDGAGLGAQAVAASASKPSRELARPRRGRLPWTIRFALKLARRAAVAAVRAAEPAPNYAFHSSRKRVATTWSYGAGLDRIPTSWANFCNAATVSSEIVGS